MAENGWWMAVLLWQLLTVVLRKVAGIAGSSEELDVMSVVVATVEQQMAIAVERISMSNR